MIIDLCCRNTVFPLPWRPMLVYQSIVARLHNYITSGYLISAHSLNLSLVHSSVSSVSVSMGTLIKLVQRLCRCLDASVEWWCYMNTATFMNVCYTCADKHWTIYVIYYWKKEQEQHVQYTPNILNNRHLLWMFGCVTTGNMFDDICHEQAYTLKLTTSTRVLFNNWYVVDFYIWQRMTQRFDT